MTLEMSDRGAMMLEGAVLAEALGWLVIEGHAGDVDDVWGFRLTEKGAAVLEGVRDQAGDGPELTASFLVESCAEVAREAVGQDDAETVGQLVVAVAGRG